jgi:O-antigen/teichoic acid export membrane protein
MDVIVLAWIVPGQEVGHFAAAQQVLVAVYLLSWLLGSVLLPELVRLSSSSSALHTYVGHWVRLLTLTSVPLAILGAASGPIVMRLVYGKDFASAGIPFSILWLTMPFVLLNALYLNRAIALGNRSLYVSSYVIGAGAGVVADLVLTLTLGIIGTALAAFLREVGMFCILHFVGAPKRSEAMS